MNDPNKVINVNLSSLLSLKAELLRKQAEVSKAKVTQTSTQEFIANKSASSQNHTSGNKRKDNHKKDIPKEEDIPNKKYEEYEDGELLRKSQRVLQAKAKFYEKMSKSGGSLNSDDHCLVLFNRKKQDECDVERSTNYDNYSESDVSSSSEEENSSHDKEQDDEDWVEYVDCLGRTRKCLREDLEAAKKRDSELAASMPERIDQSKANWMMDSNKANNEDDELLIGPLPTESICNDTCSTMSKLDEQKASWERKEKENLEKEEVHYQDVFFDEARQHGVGYYAFSTDEEQRKKQQKELEKRREETIAEQKHRDELRAHREKIIAERVKAARNRQRARQGLPPLEENENEENTKEEKVDETKEQRKERKHAEKLKRKQKKEEKAREMERDQHIRPWDKDKYGNTKKGSHGFQNRDSDSSDEDEWSYKPEREPMSQEEWNEKQRAERKTEFAPMPESTSSSSRHSSSHMKRTNFSNVPPPPQQQLYNMDPPSAYDTNAFIQFQSTKRDFQRRNNETIDETGYEQRSSSSSSNSVKRSGAAIPPPVGMDMDYTPPPHTKKSKNSYELENSIEAGLRFLRENSDKGTMSTKSSWTAKADY